jgi:hypothetical protein
MLERALNPNDIVGLLSKLKAKTPDYSPDMMAARRAAFVNQAIAIKFDGPKQGGKGGGDGGSSSMGGSGGSGALGGTAQGVLLQAVVGFGVIAGMLTTAYAFRDQITSLLQDNEVVVEITQAPDFDSPDSGIAPPAPESPLPEVPPTEIADPPATPSPDTLTEGNSAPESSSDEQGISENPEEPKDNGLHLGQTPGAPEPPNQDKPDKPDKPEKPNKPGKNK